MPNKTTNYNLTKPLPEEFYDVSVHNDNMDIIDRELKKRATLGDDGKVPSSQLPSMNYVPTSEKGKAKGVATLGDDGKVPSSQLPETKDGSGKRTARITIGSSVYGWTASDCDYLCNGTNDDIIIKSAISALPSTGGEIVFLDGSYNISSSIDITKSSVTLTGNGASTKIVSAGAGTLFKISASNCTVKNLYFDGANNQCDCINILDTSSFVTIKNNHFINTTGNGIMLSGNEFIIIENYFNKCNVAIQSQNCNRMLITNNIVYECTSHGMILGSNNGCIVIGNTVGRSKDSGICISSFTGNSVTSNNLHDNGKYGIEASSGTDISGNVVANNVYENNTLGDVNDESILPYTYGTEDIAEGSASPYENGHIHFIYEP